MWIFGYGSLLYKADFPYEERRVAFVSGFTRRLDQGSPDHRGTPDRLGRVATLLASPGEICGGAVFRIPDATADATLRELDVREQGGYERIELDVTLPGASVEAVKAVTWLAPAGNPFYLGSAPHEMMLEQIRGAKGPSGTNTDYVIALDDALRALGLQDVHVATLAKALRGAR